MQVLPNTYYYISRQSPSGGEGVLVGGFKVEVGLERGLAREGLTDGVLLSSPLLSSPLLLSPLLLSLLLLSPLLLSPLLLELFEEVHFCLLGLVLMVGAGASGDVELLLEAAGVVGGEVVAVVLHAVGVDRPDLVLGLLDGEHLGGVVLHEFGGVLEELDLHLGNGLDLLLVQLHRGQRAVVLERLQLVDHEALLLDVAVRRTLLLLVDLPLVDFGVLQVLEEAGLLAGAVPVEGGDAFVGVDLLVSEVAVDDVLAQRHEVQPRTQELGVPGLAVLAREDLELVQLVLALVPQLAVQLEVQVALAQHGHQLVVAEAVDDRVDDGLEAEGRGGLGDEVGVEQEGLVALLDCGPVDDEAAVGAVVLAGEEADLAVLEDEQVEVGLHADDELLGVRDLGLDDLGEREERLLHHVVEEEQVLEDGLVGLLEVVDAVGGGQLLHELHLLLDVEQLLDVRVLLDVVVDLPGQLLLDAVLVRQLLEDLQVLAALDVLRTDVRDQRPHAADVVGKDHAADRLDQDHAARLLVRHRHDVPEPDRQHHRRPPVVRPDVTLVPGRIRDLPRHHPVLSVVEVGHLQQDDRQDVRETEVEEQHLHQRPVLLVVVVLNEVDLQLLQLLHAVGELEESDQTQTGQRGVGGSDAYKGNGQIGHVQVEALLLVALPDLAVGGELPAQPHPHRRQVDHDLEQEDEEADDLDGLDHGLLLELLEDQRQAVDEDREQYVDQNYNADHLLLALLQLEAVLVQHPRPLLARKVQVDRPQVDVIPLQFLNEGLLNDIHLLGSDDVLELPPLLPPALFGRVLQTRRTQVFTLQQAGRLVSLCRQCHLPVGKILTVFKGNLPVLELARASLGKVEGCSFERGPSAWLLLGQYGNGVQLGREFLDIDLLLVLEAARQADVRHRTAPFRTYIYSTNLLLQQQA